MYAPHACPFALAVELLHDVVKGVASSGLDTLVVRVGGGEVPAAIFPAELTLLQLNLSA